MPEKHIQLALLLYLVQSNQVLPEQESNTVFIVQKYADFINSRDAAFEDATLHSR